LTKVEILVIKSLFEICPADHPSVKVVIEFGVEVIYPPLDLLSFHERDSNINFFTISYNCISRVIDVSEHLAVTADLESGLVFSNCMYRLWPSQNGPHSLQHVVLLQRSSNHCSIGLNVTRRCHTSAELHGNTETARHI
jgi:hypothetical protein